MRPSTRSNIPSTTVSGAYLDQTKDSKVSVTQWGAMKMDRSIVNLDYTANSSSPDLNIKPSADDTLTGKLEKVINGIKALDVKMESLEEKVSLIVDAIYPDEY